MDNIIGVPFRVYTCRISQFLSTSRPRSLTPRYSPRRTLLIIRGTSHWWSLQKSASYCRILAACKVIAGTNHPVIYAWSRPRTRLRQGVLSFGEKGRRGLARRRGIVVQIVVRVEIVVRGWSEWRSRIVLRTRKLGSWARRRSRS